MARILDEAGRELIGYIGRWSAQAGQRVQLMVSTTEPTFDVRLVRLRHGDPNPAGPGVSGDAHAQRADGSYPGGVQAIRCGSYAVIEEDEPSRTLGVWAWPTRPDAGVEQVLLQRGGLTVLIGADGRVSARAGALEVQGGRLARERWVCLTAVLGEERLSLDGRRRGVRRRRRVRRGRRSDPSRGRRLRRPLLRRQARGTVRRPQLIGPARGAPISS